MIDVKKEEYIKHVLNVDMCSRKKQKKKTMKKICWIQNNSYLCIRKMYHM